MSEKPVIFISHASFDAALAISLKAQIEAAFGLGKVEVFVSSDVRAIAPGEQWFQAINQKLDYAHSLVVLITPESEKSTWVGYEIGYFWKRKTTDSNLYIYPLFIPGAPIFGPLTFLQAKSLDDSEAVEFWLQMLCDQFEIEYTSLADVCQILEQTEQLIQFYKKLQSHSSNMQIPEEWTEQEVEELFQKRFEAYLSKEFWLSPPLTTRDMVRNLFDRDHGRTIYKGKTISYRQLDEQLEIPNGTSKKLLKKIAQRYGLVPNEEKESENSISFNFIAPLSQ